ncbi:copper amine oxidase N-terminal domain-containing protein [Anaerobacillus alkaliphilus]|uniref:Copper amine oxidase N-terminal domain-containing protein n=1 Tax=Anaerobacillus alkaliphilus TaxID=1548597 RepID=A0A4Q0VU99_9BACI|nr:copper amine oxidase N-terminal domain-containing protein [Anaerobacillus alkaliphilus]RXJ00744.1 copper amine oxidase N-terminal domain-containing protein [Anaerobacillus alkaliphilus]
MNSKKMIALVLSTSVLTLSAGTIFASKDISQVEGGHEIIPISAEIDQINQSHYHSFTGSVTEMRESDGVEGSMIVTVKNDQKQIANIIISKDTYLLGENPLEVGTVITGFYDAHAPMLMIYPPQYNTEVVVVGELGDNIKVDLFDQNLVSADFFLKLNVSEETEIISQNGENFEGDVSNRHLAVLYGITTRSIPAQTSPSKIIVLNKKQEFYQDVASMDIVVDNQKIEAPSPYQNEDGVIMIPVRAIAEALGFPATWEGKTQSVRIGMGITLTIGKDYYTYMRTAPIYLGAAPELINGVTYVPLHFFTDVMRLTNAYVFEGQIVIDDLEKME